METVLVKKPSNGEDLELLDSECFYAENQPSQCIAPIEYRCPYRRFKEVIEAPHGGRMAAGTRILPDPKPTRLSPSRR